MQKLFWYWTPDLTCWCWAPEPMQHIFNASLKKEMRLGIFLGCWSISLINGKYILVDVEDGDPTPDKYPRKRFCPFPPCNPPSGKQCTGRVVKAPWSDCDVCSCIDGCIWTNLCTRDPGCGPEKRGLFQKCDLDLKNCAIGLKCIRVS